ncbi:hypothetical protein IP87_06430 [beta proteobacterium AAP121]|nr:hypothetical protein IP80_01215 [beta proteobacterium AAP65]KPF99151.1 hypothetical protein IP87_06430 [beta proteobacterium AAP121]
MKFKLIVIAATLALAGTAQAQTPAPAAAPAAPVSEAKKALVARVLQLQQPGVEAMARQLTEQPARQLLQRAGQALQGVPAERREALARDIEADVRKYADEATPIVVSRAVQLAPSTIGALLEERLTEDELREVIGILESPANRKFQALGADMQRAIGEKLVAETRGEIGPKVVALEQAVAARLQPPADAANAAKPKPAAKPAAPAKKP